MFKRFSGPTVQPPPEISTNDPVMSQEKKIDKTQPLIFSADETADVGLDNQTPVAEGIGIGRDATRFTGKIRKVTVEVKEVK